MTIRARHVLEYVALRAIAGLLQALPCRLAMGVAWTLAWLTHALLRRRIREAHARMAEVFGPALPPRVVRRKAWEAWRNLVFGLVDLIRVRRMDAAWVTAHIEGWDHAIQGLRAHLQSGKGAVIACPHMGAWDIVGMALRLFDIPVFFIVAHQKNRLIDDYAHRMRGSTGAVTLHRGSHLLRHVMRRLRAGEMLAILPDVRSASEGVPVEFLGKTANLGRGMALFARMADVPIIPAFATRRGWTQHAVRLGAPVHPDQGLDREEDIRRMTAAVMRQVESAIRAEPEQWFWYNKRWVLEPLVTSPGRTPPPPTSSLRAESVG